MTHVDWHPYPKEKPSKSGDFLVTVKKVECEIVMTRFYNDWAEKFNFNDKQILAWTELPEPYKPPIEKKRSVHIDYFGKNADDIWGWNDDKDGEKE